MKLEKEVFQVEKSEGLKEYKFKLPEDIAGVKLIIDLLSSKLYVDKEISSIREIYTNAIDANIEAGNAHIPIDIICPTDEDPYVSFRDYGLGMSPDLMIQTYINLGASTKRDTNTLHGGFGIGSISPFTITSQIEVTTINKGIKYSWVVFKNEEGIPALSLLDERETEELNGTLVKFKVPLEGLWRVKCFISLLHTISQKKSKIEREDKEHKNEREKLIVQETEDYLVIFPKDTTKIFEPSYLNILYVLVGDIPYGIDISKHDKTGQVYPTVISPTASGWYLRYSSKIDFFGLKDYYNIFLKAPIGKLTLTSSREKLVENKELKDFIIPTLNQVLEKSYNSLCQKVEQTEDLVEKIETAFNNFPFLKKFESGEATYFIDYYVLSKYFPNENTHYYLYDFESATDVTLVFKDKDNKINEKHLNELFSHDLFNRCPFTLEIFQSKNLKAINLNNIEELKVINLNDVIISTLIKRMKLTALLKADIVLAKSSYQLKSILNNFEFAENKFTLIFRVKKDIYESYLERLSYIKEVFIYENEPSKPKEEKEVNIYNLTKQDKAYKLELNRSVYSSAKYKELSYTEVLSLSIEGGIFVIKENLNNEIDLKVSRSLNYLIETKDKNLNNIYLVNPRVGGFLDTLPNWKGLCQYTEEKIKDILPKSPILKEAVNETVLLHDDELGNWNVFLQECSNSKYPLNEEYISFINSKEFYDLLEAKKLNIFVGAEISKLELIDNDLFKEAYNIHLKRLFSYLFSSDLDYFIAFLPVIEGYKYFRGFMSLAVRNTVDYLNLKKGLKSQ